MLCRGIGENNTRPLCIIYEHVNLKLGRQHTGRQWQPLSVHLRAYCNPPIAHDVSDGTRLSLLFSKSSVGSFKFPVVARSQRLTD